ncbi:Vacuolar protein-sorting-associated protein 36 [Sorochytrium milnesiophthora]
MTVNPLPLSDAVASLRRRQDRDSLSGELEALTLQDEQATFAVDTYFTQQGALGDYLNLAITKVTLSGTADAQTGSDKAWKDAKADLLFRCQQLVSHTLTLPASLGLTLLHKHNDTAIDILLAVQALICDIEAKRTPISSSSSSTQPPSSADLSVGKCLLDTGVAWKTAETLKGLPRSNVQAVTQAWTAKLELVRDVVAETGELVTAAASTDEGVETDEEDDEGTALNPTELETARLAHKLVQLLVIFMKRVSQELPKFEGQASVARELDTLAPLATQIQESLDVLGSSLYSPQDTGSIQQSITELAEQARQVNEAVTRITPTNVREAPPLVNATRPLLAQDEALAASQGGVGLYAEGKRLEQFDAGTVYITSHRLLWVNESATANGDAAQVLGLPLKDVLRIDTSGAFLSSSAKIILRVQEDESAFESKLPSALHSSLPSSSQSSLTSDPWQCPICAFANTSNPDKCEQCGVRRANKQKDVAAAGTESLKYCPTCTYLNKGIALACQAAPAVHEVKLSFRKGGLQNVHSALKLALGRQAWKQFSAQSEESSRRSQQTSTAQPVSAERGSPAAGGVAAIITRNEQQVKQNEATLQNAFQDLDALMAKAADMVKLAESISSKLKSNAAASTAASSSSQDDISTEETIQFRDFLVNLGITSGGVITKEGSGSSYHRELAKELVMFLDRLLEFQQQQQSQNRYRTQHSAGAIISLADLYCMFNRARGIGGLVSPNDLLAAAELLETAQPQRMADTRFCLKRFPQSSVLAVQCGQHFSDEQVMQRVRSYLQSTNEQQWPSVSAFELAKREGLSLTLATEFLAQCEAQAVVCRDESAFGVRFYANRDKMWERETNGLVQKALMLVVSEKDQDFCFGRTIPEGREEWLGPERDMAVWYLQSFASMAYCFHKNATQPDCYPFCNRPEFQHVRFNTTLIGSTTQTLGFIAVDETNESIVVSFRGTNNKVNWEVDGLFPLIHFVATAKYRNIPKHAKVMLGFCALEHEHALLESVKALLHDYPSFKVVFVGHSLGAAIASIAATFTALVLDLPKEQVLLLTLGSPTPGNRAFAQLAEQSIGTIHRLVEENDISPPRELDGVRLYHHIGPEKYIVDGKIYVCVGIDIDDPQCSSRRSRHRSMNSHRQLLGQKFMGVCAHLVPKPYPTYNALCDRRKRSQIGYLQSLLSTCIEKKSIPDALMLPGTHPDMRKRRMNDDDIDIVLTAQEENDFIHLLDVSFNEIGDRGAASIAQWLRKTTIAEELRLSGNSIGAAGAQAISEALHSNKSLKVLDLSGNEIGDEGGLHIAAMLQINTTLKNLVISRTGLSVQSLIALCTVMRKNSTILTLDISDNLTHVDVQTATTHEDVTRHITRMLTDNTGLQTLRLGKLGFRDWTLQEYLSGAVHTCRLTKATGRNRIMRDGAIALANALWYHPALEVLSLAHNQIQNEGCVGFAQMLKENDRLRRLDLSHNNIGGPALKVLADCLSFTNRTLKSLRVWGNNFDQDACLVPPECLALVCGGSRNADQRWMDKQSYHKLRTDELRPRFMPGNLDVTFYCVEKTWFCAKDEGYIEEA